LPAFSHAGVKTFIKEYTYQASEMDSKYSSRVNALMEVKRLLLEEIGIYIVSRTVVENSQVAKDEISIFTAGIVKTQIKKETWNGKQYWLKAEIQVDPDDVNDKLEKFRSDWDRTDELKAVQKQLKLTLADNEKLRNELRSIKDRPMFTQQLNQYNQNIDKIKALDLYTQAIAMYQDNSFQGAIELLQQSINLNAHYQLAHEFLGRCFFESGQKSLTRKTAKDILARKFNPAEPETYSVRGFAYHVLNDEAKAVREYTVGIKLNSKDARLYRNRSHSLSKLRRIGPALEDINRAIELEPNDYRNYMIRGAIYGRNINITESMADFEKALQMNPKSAKTYFMRGIIYKYFKKDLERAKQDIRKACKMGFYMACTQY
jgi:tetratricopeptide (TPR) repeat protein